jgi:hypothetical protein
MSKYKITGGNQGAVGDNASAQNFTQSIALTQELSELRSELAKRARTPEQIAAVKHVADAEEAAKKGDDDTVRQKLKAVGTWGLQVATEIGKSVAAKVISSQLGV